MVGRSQVSGIADLNPAYKVAHRAVESKHWNVFSPQCRPLLSTYPINRCFPTPSPSKGIHNFSPAMEIFRRRLFGVFALQDVNFVQERIENLRRGLLLGDSNRSCLLSKQ